MRAQLLHLSGPLRGRTVTHEEGVVTVGSAPGADVHLPVPLVAPAHAEIRFVEADCAFHLVRVGGQVFVNRSEIEEVVLDMGDTIEFGAGGPRARFSIWVPPGRTCKPVRRMLADAKAVGRASGRLVAAGSLVRDLLTQATPLLKVAVPLLLVFVLGLGYLAGWLGARPALRAANFETKARRTADSVLPAEIAELRKELEQQKAALARAQSANVTLRRVQRELSRGVCLVYGVFAVQNADGTLAADEDGDPFVREYTGSGFLARDDGAVVTNRHVVRPWEGVESARRALGRGCRAEFLQLSATFPGGRPVQIDPATIAVSPEAGVDVAIFVLPLGSRQGVPVLPMHEGSLDDLPDQHAIVVGYPTGLSALMAKADQRLVGRLQAERASMSKVIEQLAEAGSISPMITEGTLGNQLERLLVYDAVTTHGGSGGPVFGSDGTVIAVNAAIMPGFSGANFGVPIRFARELLR
jgi:S1-C subfamily serine protease